LCLSSFQPFQFFVDVFGGITQLVSINAAGTSSGNFGSNFPSFSPNSRFIVFNSNASDLTPVNDTNGTGDVFLRDLQTGTTSLVSVNRDGTQSGNNMSYTLPEDATGYLTSGDGRFVVFTSRATDLTATADTNGAFDDVFVRDMQTRVTTLVSINR